MTNTPNAVEMGAAIKAMLSKLADYGYDPVKMHFIIILKPSADEPTVFSSSITNPHKAAAIGLSACVNLLRGRIEESGSQN